MPFCAVNFLSIFVLNNLNLRTAQNGFHDEYSTTHIRFTLLIEKYREFQM
jgi:hypothetical protein